MSFLFGRLFVWLVVGVFLFFLFFAGTVKSFICGWKLFAWCPIVKVYGFHPIDFVGQIMLIAAFISSKFILFGGVCGTIGCNGIRYAFLAHQLLM